MCVYGYVIMHKHVHLLVNEPERPTLSDAIHYLKLSFAKRLRSRKGTIESRSFWQKRYYDRNVRDEREFSMKLRYLHRNPVKRGLVQHAKDWAWSSFTHYATGAEGIVEIESEWTARRRERMRLASTLMKSRWPSFTRSWEAALPIIFLILSPLA